MEIEIWKDEYKINKNVVGDKIFFQFETDNIKIDIKEEEAIKIIDEFKLIGYSINMLGISIVEYHTKKWYCNVVEKMEARKKKLDEKKIFSAEIESLLPVFRSCL